ncbi:unnamed protein product, partial [Ectocarpus sp. 4 AP-2014]
MQYSSSSSQISCAVVRAGKTPVLQQPACDERPAGAFCKPCRSGSAAFVSSNNDRGVTHFLTSQDVTRRHTTHRSMASSLLSAEDIDKLQRRFSTLEADIDALSTALSQLPAARSSRAGSARRLSSHDRPFGMIQVADGVRGLFGSPPTRTTHPPLLGHLMVAFVTAAVALVLWRVWLLKDDSKRRRRIVVCSPTEDRRGVHRHGGRAARHRPASCDVAFLAHPGVLLSTFARWMPEKRPLRRWQASWWMIPAWPITLVISLWFMFIAPLLSGPYLLADKFELKGVANQVWLSRAFGYQFMMKLLRRRIARGIEATVREADRAGVSVLGLGALNKAEFINRGGEDVLDAFMPRTTRLVHGNTLTAAVVVENVKAAVAANPAAAAVAEATSSENTAAGTGDPSECTSNSNSNSPCVFLTGATSKVGRAVALRLALDGYDVVCCTSSDERFACLVRELTSLRQQEQQQQQPGVKNRAGGLKRARRLDEGVYFRLWVVGKFDTSVRLNIPLKASAVVFAVPCPLEGHRPDVARVTGGIVRMDLSCCTPRRFHVLLPFDQLYACHAAAIVHHRMGWAHHEVGKVDVGRMATILKAAGDCGFSVPFSWPSSPAAGTTAITTSKLPRHDDVIGGVESGNITDPEQPVDEYYSGEFKEVTRPGEGGVVPRPRGVAGGAARWREGGGVFLPRPGGVSVTTGWSGHDSGCGGGTSAALSLGEGGRRSRTTSQAPGLGPPSPSPGMLPRDIQFQAAGQTARTPEKMTIFLNQAGVQQKHHCNDADAQATARAPSTGLTDRQDRIPATGASWNGLHESCDGILPASPPLDTGRGENSKERAPGSLGVRVGTGVSEMDCPASGYSDGAEPQPRRRPPVYCRVVVVGAGASGLSAAACLRARGEDGVVILERSESVCGAWARQYEGLRITTRRRHCGLPGWPVPPEGFCDNGCDDDCADDTAHANNSNAASGFYINSNSSNDNHATGAGDEMSAQSFVRYLRAYRRRFDLAVFTETEVLGAEREAVSPSTRRGDAGARAGGIDVRFRRYSNVSGNEERGETAVSVVRCDHVVVATGKCSSPRMPSTVLENLRGFSGEV